jgi:Surface glycan-binding protein B xyloglucan binding domain/IPT/TIG domain
MQFEPFKKISMKIQPNKINVFLAVSLLAPVISFNACNSDKEVSSATVLESFGPSVNRGTDDLKFIGKNLNNVTAIVLPKNIEVPSASFKTKTSTLITLTVPEEAVSGKVTLKTPNGDIETKTELSILEPITIASISPSQVRPGDEITISGTYLNLIKTAIFKESKVVNVFTAQSKTTLKMLVPADAQTGSVTLLDGEVIPNQIQSPTTLKVAVPLATQVSPTALRAGQDVTVTGTDLDLTKEIRFGGDRSVNTFKSKKATELVVTVPSNAQDGKIKLFTASGVVSESSQSITLAIPTLATLTPNPMKNGGMITVTGTNLDLTTSVVFGGNKTGAIQGGATSTQLVVKVPADATDGAVTFNTDANKSVTSSPLTVAVPTVTSVNPMSVNTANDPSLTINGTDLDVINEIVFEGNWSAKSFTSQSTNSITVKVVPGSVTGKVKLMTTNGTSILTDVLTIVPNVPNITSMPSDIFIGSLVSINGTKLTIPSDVIFPGNVKATIFGSKSSTLIEVVVPEGATLGTGKIKFVTTKNEIYESPGTTIKRLGVEAVQDQNLVYFDFNGTGTKDSWWGAVSIVKDANSIDNTSFGKINGGYSGWTDLFWRNGSNNFPGSTIGSNVNQYVVKFDINVLAPITAGSIKFRLNGSEGDFWYLFGPASPSGAIISATGGWTTMTVPISAFVDNFGWGTNSPTDISKISKQFGAAFDDGSSTVNILIDNIRFHKK